MGGLGSGQWRTARTATVEVYHALDIAELRRAGLIGPSARRSTAPVVTCAGRGFSFLLVELTRFTPHGGQLTVRFLVPTLGSLVDPGAPWARAEALITLLTSRQRLGGRRYWFGCPSCGARCRKLYRRPHGSAWACRHCHSLAYRSQRISDVDRMEWRAAKIVSRLGGERSDGMVYKPPRMRWATFCRLMRQVQELNDDAIRLRLSRLGWLRRAIERRRRR